MEEKLIDAKILNNYEGDDSLIKIRVDCGFERGERFWLTDCKIENGYLFGKVDNDLVYTDIHGLKIGDKVKVKVLSIN